MFGPDYYTVIGNIWQKEWKTEQFSQKLNLSKTDCCPCLSNHFSFFWDYVKQVLKYLCCVLLSLEMRRDCVCIHHLVEMGNSNNTFCCQICDCYNRLPYLFYIYSASELRQGIAFPKGQYSWDLHNRKKKKAFTLLFVCERYVVIYTYLYVCFFHAFFQINTYTTKLWLFILLLNAEIKWQSVSYRGGGNWSDNSFSFIWKMVYHIILWCQI